MATRARIAVLAADPAFATLRRSLEVYYGDAARDAAMDALYARFLRAGDLAFDIGAHVGDRRKLPPLGAACRRRNRCAHRHPGVHAGDDGVTR
jgi:hypothetical protein